MFHQLTVFLRKQVVVRGNHTVCIGFGCDVQFGFVHSIGSVLKRSCDQMKLSFMVQNISRSKNAGYGCLADWCACNPMIHHIYLNLTVYQQFLVALIAAVKA